MAGLSSVTTPVPRFPAVPYLTTDELKRSPIYNQLQKLVPGGSAADNDAELGRIISRASALINGELRWNQAAAVAVEEGWVTTSDLGELRIHTLGNPVVSVSAVSVGSDPYFMAPLTDLSQAVLQPWRITVPARAWRSCGPRRRVWAQWTYVAGYPVTTLATAVAAGDTSMTVVDATGIVAGETVLTVQDGKWLEQVAPTAVVGNVLTVAPLEFPHQPKVGVSSLPDDIQEAALLLISRLHNSWSLSMGAVTHDGTGARKPNGAAGSGARALCDAGVMLAPYRRRW